MRNTAKEANIKKVAQKTQVREVAFEGPVWVGVDVHKKSYSVATTDKQGVLRVFSMAVDDTGLVGKLQQLSNPVAVWRTKLDLVSITSIVRY